ncbi:MAG TPA: hypothetical protein PLP17_11010 [Oligoflexia bacterium]|nr:hypothetical protein [Oligoflexia bacterium]
MVRSRALYDEVEEQMTQQSMGLVLGGLIPAVMFALSGVFAKSSTQAGIGIGPYLGAIGLTVCGVGAVCCFFVPDKSLNWRSCAYACASGFCWAAGAGLVALALNKYAAPISKLVPLYNMNTLLAVMIGLWIFSEWAEVNVARLMLGALLVVLGGILVSAS